MPSSKTCTMPELTEPSASRAPQMPRPRELAPWLILLAGLAALYVPTIVDFAQGPWRGDRNSHGPIVLALSVWFFYFQAKRIQEQRLDLPRIPAPLSGSLMVAAGLSLYVLGRSQALPMFELGSLIPLLIGLALLFFGRRIAARFWFAFFLLFFAIPMPASVVDTLTQPMKLAVSISTVELLHAFGYPVARSGVIINIGSYQLLVADACAGLNSLFTLEALGLLYMNVMRHESVFRNITLATLIVPISFAANVTRVMILSLLTYYFGDDVGQGFLHEFSGMVLFLTALFLIFGADGALRALARRFERRSA